MINGITSDSRSVKPGFAFVAVKGLTVDGHDYIEQAFENGAVVVYGEDPSARYARSGLNYVQVSDSRQKLAELARDFYNDPSSKLKVIGVTGTKGKTTTAHIIHHILEKTGHKAGLISSISVPGLHVTNPDVVTLNAMLADMVKKGYKYAVVEVSSHGIDQKRIARIKFEVGVLTNIAPEHLDYHKTFKEYKRVKMSFINSARYKVISAKKSNLRILPGEFNNINADAAVATAGVLGIDQVHAIKAIYSFKLPEGRLEEIKTSKDFRVFIDFAHTPNSLEAVLNHLRAITKGRLISVLGCAGLRDRKKRAKMGQISTKIADISIFTAEDPRVENITDILHSMKKKATAGKYIAIAERAEAIAYAISIAKKGDILAFLGKGHEKSMAYQSFEHPWNEKEFINAQLKPMEDVSAIIMAAGKGSRMKSWHPKVLREICGRPILSYVLESLRGIGISDIVAVVSYRKNLIQNRYPYSLKFAVQKNPKGGTGDAVRVGLNEVSTKSKYVLAFYGDDSAFFRPSTTKAIIADHKQKNATISFASMGVVDPYGLGRVIRNKLGYVENIVEEKEATDEQKKVSEVNCGHFVFNKDWLTNHINKIRTSTTGEIYIVDLIKTAIGEGKKVNACKLEDSGDWHGINTPEQLLEAERKMRERLLS